MSKTRFDFGATCSLDWSNCIMCVRCVYINVACVSWKTTRRAHNVVTWDLWPFLIARVAPLRAASQARRAALALRIMNNYRRSINHVILNKLLIGRNRALLLRAIAFKHFQTQRTAWKIGIDLTLERGDARHKVGHTQWELKTHSL